MQSDAMAATAPTAAAASVAAGSSLPPQRAARERELKDVYIALGAHEGSEVLNERAVSVMQRMAAKLTGRDGVTAVGAPVVADSVKAQVERLIVQATSHENLCQSYIGWCPFW